MQKEHDQVTELLPWYVNETLSGRENDRVLKHLAECRECQQERDRLYELQALVKEGGAEASDYELSFRRVMKRIETAERNRASASDADSVQGRRRWLPLGLAASIVSVVLASAAFMSFEENESVQEFQTLSSDLPGQGATQRLELGFANPIPASTMRKALIETSSNIVSGPDASGNYLVEVTVPSSMSEAEYLEYIREIEGVESARYVER